MKKFFYVAIAATALASCSSDNLVDLKEGDEIKFTAVADNDSRAATVFCNYNLPKTFQLYAATVASAGKEAQDFIVNEEYERTGDVTYERAEGKNRYWPENDALDFYAVKNAEITWEAGAVPTGSFEVDGVVESQLDFIYAANPAQKKPTTTGTTAVALNFRHALSQIEFKVVNSNPDLEIIVKNVKVGNALSEGDFTFPTTTAGNWQNHNQEATDKTQGNVITWNNQATPKNYTLASDFADVTVLNGQTKPLTFETSDIESADFANIYKQSMLLLPQTGTAKWNGTNGAFLAVKCVINNIIKDGKGNITDRVVLYGDKDDDGVAEGRWAFVPVEFTWNPGYKYVYTFNFTNGGNAGYDDGKGDERPGDVAVLLPLTVNVTVDDFQPTTGSTENMETQP